TTPPPTGSRSSRSTSTSRTSTPAASTSATASPAGRTHPANGPSTTPASCGRRSGRSVLDDDFTGPELDRSVWLPHYLPAWSSRARTAATYEVAESRLRLSIPPAQGLWCAGDHHPDMRVSAVQSGSFSGPVGSTVGQQPYREGLTVREEQPTFWGCTPQYGRIEVRARLVVRRGSMAAFWLVGLEDRPERSAEICVMECSATRSSPGGRRRWAWVCTPSATPTSSRTSPPSGCRSTSPSRTTTPSTGHRTVPSCASTARSCAPCDRKS